jgi:uncharacterized protein (DUF305 family)
MRTKNVVAYMALALSPVLIACGGSGSGDKAAETSSFNSQDVTFAVQMIPHHLQATEMAGTAESRTKNQAVLDLAGNIKAAQAPEIDMMTDWLQAWGKNMPGGDHSMEGMDDGEGMMSDSELVELEAKSGKAFDRQFLSMMIEHHRGAIDMAKDEEAKGKLPAAVDLAKKIQADQAKEITLMESLLEN